MIFSQRSTFLFFLLFSLLAYAAPEDAHQHMGVITQNVRGVTIEFLGENAEFDADSVESGSISSQIISEALALSGTPYKTGGTSPQTGFDCSGFVRYVFHQAANITLPASAKKIANIGKIIDKNALIPGDLVFFNTLKSTYSHVAIYIGDQTFIHAPSAGGVVRVDRIDAAYWSRHYEGARRIALD